MAVGLSDSEYAFHRLLESSLSGDRLHVQQDHTGLRQTTLVYDCVRGSKTKVVVANNEKVEIAGSITDPEHTAVGICEQASTQGGPSTETVTDTGRRSDAISQVPV